MKHILRSVESLAYFAALIPYPFIISMSRVQVKATNLTEILNNEQYLNFFKGFLSLQAKGQYLYALKLICRFKIYHYYDQRDNAISQLNKMIELLK